jgi:hypothetical protein
MYSDILYFGHNSIAKPESITALMVAVDQEEGDEAVRLHAEAIAAFERKRVQIVNPPLVNRPRAMELKLPQIASLPHIPSSELDNLASDRDDLDLIAVASKKPVPATPIIAPTSANSGPRELRQGLMKEPRKTVALQARCSPPPPATWKKVVLRARRKPEPSPATWKSVVLRARRKLLPAATRKRVVLRTRCNQSPPATLKSVVLQARRSPPPRRPRRRSGCGGEKNRL